MEYNNLRVNDSFMVNALRNCGYNNYSAISDIIDNSLEPEVGSSFVRVDFETEGKGQSGTTIKSILIIDDGCGMDKEMLDEAMCLGSETEKNGSINLGMYGAGLKTASLSIGQKLEVFTKSADEDLNYAVISLEDAINNVGGRIKVGFDTYADGSSEYAWFSKLVGSNHGTIVKISVLDRLSNKNFYNFKGTLKNKIGENFNKFIFANVVRFYVHKDEVPYVDLMGNSSTNELMGEGEFSIDGHTISYKAWYIPMMGGESETFEDDSHYESNNGNEYIKRSVKNQGLYIYRNNRLVGKGLNLGLWGRDGWKNGFRCEVFIDGNCDYLFGSSFTKMIGDSSADNLSQALRDKLAAEIVPYANESTKKTKKESASDDNDPNVKREKEDFYKRVTEKQNNNMMLNINRKGENKPRKKEEDEKEHKKRGKQENPNNTRKRINKWLDKFEERPLGRTAEMYLMERANNKLIVVINTDHYFYQKFYSRLNNDLKFIMAQVISCEEIAKQNVNYYGSDDIQRTIDAYNDIKSGEVMKSLS